MDSGRRKAGFGHSLTQDHHLAEVLGCANSLLPPAGHFLRHNHVVPDRPFASGHRLQVFMLHIPRRPCPRKTRCLQQPRHFDWRKIVSHGLDFFACARAKLISLASLFQMGYRRCIVLYRRHRILRSGRMLPGPSWTHHLKYSRNFVASRLTTKIEPRRNGDVNRESDRWHGRA